MKDPTDDRVKIGMITIGQSPRTDVISDIQDILGSKVEIIECGALDGLSREEIKKLEPSKSDYILVTRLRDATEVQISRDKIIDRMNQCLKKLEERSKILVILCTGEFPELQNSKKLLIEPSLLISSVVQSMLPKGRLGVLIPSPDQAQEIESKWKREGITLTIEALSPYGEPKMADVIDRAKKFQAAAVDMIVLDCIGYNKKISELIKRGTGIPVILSKTLVARIIREVC